MDTGSRSSINREQLLDKCSDIIQSWLNIQSLNYLDDLDKRLLSRSEKADNNNDQNRFYQTRQSVRQQQDLIRSLLNQHSLQAIKHFLAGKDTCGDFQLEGSDNETLSLVDQDELEQNIAIRSMVKRASADCAIAIYALNQRFAALTGGDKITERNNPVAPGVFAEAVEAAMSDLIADHKAKLVVYKCFDRQFMAQLDTLYTQLNELLQSNGVLPNLRHNVVKDACDALPEELAAQEAAATLIQQVNLFQAIQQAQLLLQNQNPRPSNFMAIPTNQLIAGIQQLQNASSQQLNQLQGAEAIAASNLTAIRQQLSQQVEKTDGIDSNMVELVGMLFDYMLNDPELPDEVKALLSYLHTPYLKAALQDNELFQQPQHPARRLLNSLVVAGQRWVETGSKRKNPVFQRLNDVVQRVLKEFQQDPQLFEELATEFNQFLSEHARRVTMSEQRAQQTAEGENKLKENRLKVSAFLDQKTEDLTLPPPLKTLLYEPWASYLGLQLLRNGPESEQWQQATQTVDDVLAFYGLTKPDHQVSQHTLIETLQAGFDTVGYDQQHCDTLLKQLSGLKEPATTAIQRQAARVNINNIELQKELDDADSPLKVLNKLKPGSWLLFNKGKASEKRLKLAWSNPNTMNFMFVNKLGQQVVVKPGAQLAEEVRSGETEILGKLNDKPFFEQALERVLNQLQKKTEKQT
jgi:hypothetical protein